MSRPSPGTNVLMAAVNLWLSLGFAAMSRLAARADRAQAPQGGFYSGPRAPGAYTAEGEAVVPSTVSAIHPDDRGAHALPGQPEACLRCRFFDRGGGVCRRYAPSVRETDEGSEMIWPPVRPDTWCGDFVPTFPVTKH